MYQNNIFYFLKIIFNISTSNESKNIKKYIFKFFLKILLKHTNTLNHYHSYAKKILQMTCLTTFMGVEWWTKIKG